MFARVKSSKTMLSDKAAFTAKLQTEGNAKATRRSSDKYKRTQHQRVRY